MKAVSSAGFGLLEAIVALVVLASSGMMLFSWISQNLATAARLGEVEQGARLALEAQALVAGVNPAETPEGNLDVAGMKLQWTSTVLQPLRDEARPHVDFVPRWQLGLYRLTVKVEQAVGGIRTEWQQVQVGRRVAPGYVDSVPESEP
jgi:general secretion pathway protein I